MNLSAKISKTRHEQRAIAIVCSFLLVLPSCIPILRRPVLAPPLPETFGGAAGPGNPSQVPIENRHDLRLMSSVGDAGDIPTAGKTLVIVADVKGVLHFRIFEGDGRIVVDTDESRLTAQAGPIADLKKRLENLWPPRQPVEEEKRQVITVVTSIVGYTLENPSQVPAENSSQVSIEEFFNDPILTCLVYNALAGNQELRVRNEDIQVASNEALSRSGAYLPFVTVGGGAGLRKYSKYSLEYASILNDPIFPSTRFFLPNPLPNFVLGTNFWWQLDIWRQLRNARDAAVQRVFAATEERNYFVTGLVAEIADGYYELIALDKRLENLNNIIALQERSLEIATSKFAAARGTDLAVQRFLAEVRKNQSQRLIVYQDIVRVENRINFRAGRFPQPVARMSERTIEEFIDLNLHALSLGVPPQLLLNRPDIRRAERELAATGLDVKVARANFLPRLIINSGVGYQAFNARYLLVTPEALIYNIAGDLVGPVINFRAIKADYLTASARQLQAVYNYQRVIINAVTEVITRMSQVEKYGRSIEIKKGQVAALVRAVQDASDLYLNPRMEVPIDYLDVLTAQQELFVARRELIDTKQEQLSAIVNTYQALGGGAYLSPPVVLDALQPHPWRLSIHSHASAAAKPGPQPLPAPAAAAERAPQPPPPPPPDQGPFQLPPPPPERGPEPIPTPAAERGPEPIPTPMGGGNGSGTAPNTDDPPG
jgi:outer membrane protein TolC